MVQRKITWHNGSIEASIDHESSPHMLRSLWEIAQASRRVFSKQLARVPRWKIRDHGIGWKCQPFLGLYSYGAPPLHHNALGFLAEMDLSTIVAHRLNQRISNCAQATLGVRHTAPGQIQRRSPIQGVCVTARGLRSDEQLGIHKEAQPLRSPSKVRCHRPRRVLCQARIQPASQVGSQPGQPSASQFRNFRKRLRGP